MRRIALATTTFLALAWAASAAAETRIYKADQFPDDIAAAATAISGVALATQPGFAQGEAFGQLYQPALADYPVKILGVQMILAAPPNAPTLTAPAFIEIWLSDATGADPGKSEPDFSISTSDLFNPSTGTLGMPLKGNTAYQVDFDWSESAGHPPLVTQGTIRAVVRYAYQAQDLSTEWGTLNCMQSEPLGMCGCQNVGVLLDQATTTQRNLIHLIWPAGTCSGTRAWRFMEDVGVTGDVILRLKVQTASTTCTPACVERVCGDDGCGGSCGACADGFECSQGACVAAGLPDAAGTDTAAGDVAVPPDAAPEAVADEAAPDVPGPGDPGPDGLADTGVAQPDDGPADPGAQEIAAEVAAEVAPVDVGVDIGTAGRSGGGCAAGATGGGAASGLASWLALAVAFVAVARRRRCA